MKKSTKWALIGVSCALLASLARACAPEYDQTKAKQTNNQTPAYNYALYLPNVEEDINQLNTAILNEEITLNK